MTENHPCLFIYFVSDIKVIQATKVGLDNKIVPRGELWLCEIGTGNGIVRKFIQTSIVSWNRHYIALEHGFWWSAIMWHEPQPQEALLVFSPQESKDAIFCIPEKYIARIYDMANRDYIYQRLSPNPPF